MKFALLVNVAVTAWWPADIVERDEEVALPPDTATEVPRFTPSTANCTLPVAVDGVMWAENVTPFPYVDGSAEDETVVEVLTITVIGALGDEAALSAFPP